jgi:succinoglycan biosynthesis protein ExoM
MSTLPGTPLDDDLEDLGTLSLIVAIPTYRRPELLVRSLPEVIKQVRAINSDPAVRIRAGVLVVDNDATATAREVAELHQGQGVRYVVEPTPGIVAARNRALDEAQDSDLLVFIDDDELPRSAWLDTLVATYRHTRAAAVMGRVVSVYDQATADPWITAGELFERPRVPTGTPIAVAACGNLLLDVRQLRASNARFDHRLGMSGGEDTLLSRQLVRAGARLVFCDESVADDYIIAERLTRTWLRKRALSQGSVAVGVELLLANTWLERSAARGRGLCRGSARIVGGIARATVGYVSSSPRHQARGLRTFFRGLGMMAAAAGYRVEEYARPAAAHQTPPG